LAVALAMTFSSYAYSELLWGGHVYLPASFNSKITRWINEVWYWGHTLNAATGLQHP